MTIHPLARLARRLVLLYPSAWRARYADEMLDLLAARAPTWGDLGDLAFHLAYTHLQPDLALSGVFSIQERLAMLMRALRSSEIAVFCAFVASIVAWLQFGGLVDGGPYQTLMSASAPWPLVTFDRHNPLILTMDIVSTGVNLAFLAVFVGGLPLALAAWRRAPRVRRLFLVPMAAFLGALLPVPIALLIRGPVATINLTFTTYCVWFVALAALSTWSLSRAIAMADLGGRLIRFAFVPSVVTAGALVVILAGTIAWGVAAHVHAPQLFDRAELNVGYATATSWGLVVAVMALAAAAAVLAVIRGANVRPSAVVAAQPA